MTDPSIDQPCKMSGIFLIRNHRFFFASHFPPSGEAGYEKSRNSIAHAFQFACVQFIPSENSAKCRICLRIRISDMYYSMLHLVVCQLGVLLKKHKFATAHEVSTKARVTYNSSERQHKSLYELMAAQFIVVPLNCCSF